MIKKILRLIKRFRTIFVLLLIVIVLGILKIKYGVKDGEEMVVEVEDREEILVNENEEEKVVIDDDGDYPLWQILPYSGKGFVIDRYVGSMKIAVQIKGIDKDIVEKDVEKWIEENGMKSDSHEIVWE